MPDEHNQTELAALLHWHRDMGADEAIGEAPINWLERGEAAPGGDFALRRPPPPAVPLSAVAPPQARRTAASDRPAASPRPFAAVMPDAALLGARTAASAAQSLADLADTLAHFDGCSLKATAKNLCFYRGATRSRLMLIGEAPGRDEDLEGRPFVGRAGQLLDKMLAASGRGEADVHITSSGYWRPPANRTPTPQEARVCRPFL